VSCRSVFISFTTFYHWAGSSRGDIVDFDLVEVSTGPPANLILFLWGFPQFIYAVAGISATIGKDQFPPYPLQFVRHHSSYHLHQYWRRHRI